MSPYVSLDIFQSLPGDSSVFCSVASLTLSCPLASSSGALVVRPAWTTTSRVPTSRICQSMSTSRSTCRNSSTQLPALSLELLEAADDVTSAAVIAAFAKSAEQKEEQSKNGPACRPKKPGRAENSVLRNRAHIGKIRARASRSPLAP